MVYAGTIIDINKKKTYLLTMDYTVVIIHTKKEYFIGQQVTFTKKDRYPSMDLIHSQTVRTLFVVAASIVLVSSLLLSGVLSSFLPGTRFDRISTALISIDINPSIELEVNKSEQIIAAYAKNEDGTKVLAELDLVEKSLTEGVDEIVATSKSLGFIDQETNIVLVSAAMYESAVDTASSDYANQLKSILATLEKSDDTTTVLTVFIEDPAIISDAKTNDLSIGKELLYQYALLQDTGLTAEDIQALSVSELLNLLNGVDISGSLNTSDQVSDNVINQNVISDNSISSNTQESSTEKVSENKVVPVVKEPVVPTDNTAKSLSVTTSNDTMNFSWTPVTGTSVTYNGVTYKGFKYYKIVASASNNRPVYPEDGYLTYISDYQSSSWSLQPSSGNYNQSPTLTPGASYYFSITYVFENGKFSSDTAIAQVPVTVAPAAPVVTPAPASSSLNLSVTNDGGTLHFNWTPIGSSSFSYGGANYTNFNFYKVVASETNPYPVYPADGYLTYLTDYNASGWSLTPSVDSYHTSPALVSGRTYYFSITYVFENGKLSSNTVQYTVP